MKDRVAVLYKEKYHDSNNCHFAELLEQQEELMFSSPSVRCILLEKGPKHVKQRQHKIEQELAGEVKPLSHFGKAMFSLSISLRLVIIIRLDREIYSFSMRNPLHIC